MSVAESQAPMLALAPWEHAADEAPLSAPVGRCACFACLADVSAHCQSSLLLKAWQVARLNLAIDPMSGAGAPDNTEAVQLSLFAFTTELSKRIAAASPTSQCDAHPATEAWRLHPSLGRCVHVEGNEQQGQTTATSSPHTSIPTSPWTLSAPSGSRIRRSVVSASQYAHVMTFASIARQSSGVSSPNACRWYWSIGMSGMCCAGTG
jgi:hypothetical protein